MTETIAVSVDYMFQIIVLMLSACYNNNKEDYFALLFEFL